MFAKRNCYPLYAVWINVVSPDQRQLTVEGSGRIRLVVLQYDLMSLDVHCMLKVLIQIPSSPPTMIH